MKRFLLLCLMTSLVGVTWAYDFEADGFCYNYVSKSALTIETTYYSEDSLVNKTYYKGDITIPLSVPYEGNTYSVVGVGAYTFRGCSELYSAVIPEGLTLDSGVFYGCTQLTSAPLPEGITEVPSSFFRECASLTSSAIPNSVTTIGTNAYNSCENLTELVIGENVVTIGIQAFQLCRKLPSVTIPESVTSIRGYAFANCESLKSFVIPDQVTTLGTYVFQNCYSLAEVKIGSGLSELNDGVFRNSGLITIEIPNNIKSMGQCIFDGCSKLVSAILPNGITIIDFGTFRNCESLITIEIPNKVNTIGECCFLNCESLSSLVIPDQVTSLGAYSFENCYSLAEVKIGSGLSVLNDAMFRNCGLASIEIPDNVTTLGNYVFDACPNLVSVTFSKNISTLSTGTFRHCESLPFIEIPENITTIDTYVFDACYSLEEVILPSRLSTISTGAFRHCDILSSIYSYNQTPPSVTSNTFQSVNTSQCVLYVPIGSKDMYGSRSVWKEFSNIVEIETPIPTITTIGVENVEKIVATLKGSVVSSIDEVLEQGFEYWTTNGAVQSIFVSGSFVGAFSAIIKGLKGNNTYTYRAFAVTERGYFYGDELSFTTADWAYDFTTINSDDVPCFYNILDDTTCELTYENSDYNSYSGHLNISKSTTYYNTDYAVVAIGAHALARSTSLFEVEIPNTVTSIGTCGFEECANLKEIYSLNPEPPICNSDAFTSVDKNSCSLYVPVESKEAYSNSTGWRDFYNITEMTEFYIETLEATDISATSATLNATLVPAYDDPITKKGFMYWEETNPNQVVTINVSSDTLSYKLKTLTSITTYVYRAFAQTANNTYYGENVSFSTNDIPEGVRGVNINSTIVEGYYTTGGEQINTPRKGVNIIRFSDGSVRKSLLK